MYNWYNTSGKTGEEPPEVIKRLYKAVDEWVTTLPGTEKYMGLGKEMLTINVKNLFVIGTVVLSPHVIIINRNIRNCRRDGKWGWEYDQMATYQPDQWFYKR